jgi:sigma-E factor negative regulatory protein RseA
MTAKNFTHEQISAFADGEVADDQFDVIMAALKTPEGRDRWAQYHEVGDVLRSEDMALTISSDFTSRLMARLDDEPTVVAPVAMTHDRATAAEISPVPAANNGIGKKRFALGGMAAAAVAALAFVAAPQIMVASKAGGSSNENTAVATAGSEQKTAAASVADAKGNGEILRSADVDEYLLAHQRFSPSVYSTAQYARSATFAVDSEK